MKRVGLIVVVTMAILLQVSLFPALRPFGVVPSLMLGLVALLGLEGPATVALAVAVVAGVTLDLSSAVNFGMWTAILVLAALSAGILRRAGFELDSPLAPAAIVTGGTLVETAVILVGLVNVVSSWPVGFLIGKFLTELVLNLLLMMLVRPLVRRVVDSPEPHVRTVG